MIIVKHKGSGVSYSNSELLDWSGLLTEVLGTADEQKRSVRVSGRYWCAVTQQILEVTATNDKEWEAMKRLPRRNWTGDFLLESKCKRRRLNRKILFWLSAFIYKNDLITFFGSRILQLT